MIVSHKMNVKGMEIKDDNMKNVIKKVLITPKEGWEGYVMRLFEIGSGGYTLRHSHPWPHINYVLKGKGKLHIDGTDYDIEEGSFAYISSNKLHQFINTGEETLELICIVPEEGDTKR
ncbi:cupin domain-containing protein [Thermoanaerobacter uzonensis]